MEQTLKNTDRILLDKRSGDISKKKKIQRHVNGQCTKRSYIVGLKRKRNYRTGYIHSQSKRHRRDRIIKSCAMERKWKARILDSSIEYIKLLKQRNTRILNLERSQMKWNRLLDNMDLILQNLEQEMDVLLSRRSHKNHEHLRSKG